MGAFILISLGFITIAFLASFLTLYDQYYNMNSLEQGNCTISNQVFIVYVEFDCTFFSVMKSREIYG